MSQINAYLNFDGNTREAMSFYQQCLGGELVMQKIAESPMAAQMPSEMGPKILHSNLSADGIVLMASDCVGKNIVNGNNVFLNINCHSSDEINTYFNGLAEGGKIIEPLHQSFWGATFGVLIDKFGINWMFNYSKK
ncbi:MAG: VOC family protein [Sphingobacteriales bacterium]|nr:VOC family protein [Sphingobacteriales bacterium]MBI3719760.1 VOC family protein [Sphingobacteriales bacterium]